MSVLVIEDDSSIRETLGFVLKAEGHDAVLLESGEAALDYLATCGPERWPDVLMLDLTLPGLSGDEVFAEIRNQYNCVPSTILMTAAISGYEKVKMLPGSVLLPKPFTLEQLSSSLENAYQNCASVRSQRVARSALH